MSEAPDREGKTEEPTQKRLMDALRRGKGPSSREIPLLFNIGAVWLILTLMLAGGAAQIAGALRVFVEHPGALPLRMNGDAVAILRYIVIYSLAALVPILGTMALGGLMASLPQSNGFVAERIKPDPARISLVAGWKRLFGKSGIQNALKSIAKLVLVTLVTAWSLRGLPATILVDGLLDVEDQLQVVTTALAKMVGGVLLAYLLVALLDVLTAWISWRRNLRMTKQEVKDEAKDSEGNPAVKHRQRMIARRRAKQRMALAVPRATVVVVNPTHYAVAMRYVESEGGAPRVVAKGTDRVALRIRAMAEELQIPVLEDRWLARSLHDQVPVDAVIPPEFYKAVARIIATLTKTRRAN
jgi:flagellar biosynthesis protein FlhB